MTSIQLRGKKAMLVTEILRETNAEILTGNKNSTLQVESAFSSDLMSDVLTLDIDNLMLITGLNNLQTIRTAEMAEIRCILFARNKRPSEDMISLANKEKIVLIVSEKSVFHLSGILFNAGLKPVF